MFRCLGFADLGLVSNWDSFGFRNWAFKVDGRIAMRSLVGCVTYSLGVQHLRMGVVRAWAVDLLAERLWSSSGCRGFSLVFHAHTLTHDLWVSVDAQSTTQ